MKEATLRVSFFSSYNGCVSQCSRLEQKVKVALMVSQNRRQLRGRRFHVRGGGREEGREPIEKRQSSWPELRGNDSPVERQHCSTKLPQIPGPLDRTLPEIMFHITACLPWISSSLTGPLEYLGDILHYAYSRISLWKQLQTDGKESRELQLCWRREGSDAAKHTPCIYYSLSA